jgi:hypothetical protein
VEGGGGEDELDGPFSSAFLTTQRAARSFTDPPGFWNSAFPKMLQPVWSERCLSRIWHPNERKSEGKLVSSVVAL